MKTAMYVDALTAIDFSVYNGKEIRGDSVALNVMITGKRNESGMISDFGKIKPRLKAICDGEVDHRLVCDPQYLSASADVVNGEFPVASGVISTQGPACMYCAIEMHNPDYLDDVKGFLHSKFVAAMPEFEFDLQLERNPRASFQYNHGLKLHDGNCQRIIHGHSAELEIVINGKACTTSHDRVAAVLNGKHFFNASDARSEAERSVISYRASQGEFIVHMPNQLLELVDGEPSIENISRHIARTLQQEHPQGTSIRVRVSEGLSKGAVTII